MSQLLASIIILFRIILDARIWLIICINIWSKKKKPRLYYLNQVSRISDISDKSNQIVVVFFSQIFKIVKEIKAYSCDFEIVQLLGTSQIKKKL